MPYNGKQSYTNDNYTMRWSGTVWEIVNGMGSQVYTSATITGIWVDYMSAPNGTISSTPPDYWGATFSDFQANKGYAFTGNYVNGNQEYFNGIYYLRYDGMSTYTIQDQYSTVIYTAISGITGQYLDIYLNPDGYISQPTSSFTGSGFTNKKANGIYWIQGNLYNTNNVFTNGICRIRDTGMGTWEIIDNMFAQIYYNSSGSVVSQFYDSMTSSPDGSIS